MSSSHQELQNKKAHALSLWKKYFFSLFSESEINELVNEYTKNYSEILKDILENVKPSERPAVEKILQASLRELYQDKSLRADDIQAGEDGWPLGALSNRRNNTAIPYTKLKLSIEKLEDKDFHFTKQRARLHTVYTVTTEAELTILIERLQNLINNPSPVVNQEKKSDAVPAETVEDQKSVLSKRDECKKLFNELFGRQLRELIEEDLNKHMNREDLLELIRAILSRGSNVSSLQDGVNQAFYNSSAKTFMPGGLFYYRAPFYNPRNEADFSNYYHVFISSAEWLQKKNEKITPVLENFVIKGLLKKSEAYDSSSTKGVCYYTKDLDPLIKELQSEVSKPCVPVKFPTITFSTIQPVSPRRLGMFEDSQENGDSKNDGEDPEIRKAKESSYRKRGK